MSINSTVVQHSLVRRLFWWVLILPAIMIYGLVSKNLAVLDFSHVMSASLWTGTDVFLGFFLGPVLKKLLPEQRKAVIHWMVPKTMLYIPVLAFTAGTSGWYIAMWEGLTKFGNPMHVWLLVAFIVVMILMIQGLGIMLPNSIRIYLEFQKEQPDFKKIFRLNKVSNVVAGLQGAFQIAIIIVMVHIAIG